MWGRRRGRGRGRGEMETNKTDTSRSTWGNAYRAHHEEESTGGPQGPRRIESIRTDIMVTVKRDKDSHYSTNETHQMQGGA